MSNLWRWCWKKFLIAIKALYPLSNLNNCNRFRLSSYKDSLTISLISLPWHLNPQRLCKIFLVLPCATFSCTISVAHDSLNKRESSSIKYLNLYAWCYLNISEIVLLEVFTYTTTYYRCNCIYWIYEIWSTKNSEIKSNSINYRVS